MIFAKSYAIEKQLEKGWSNNSKIYLALTEGIPEKPEGVIESWLSETKELRVYSGPKTEDAKHAVTHYRVLKTNKQGALLEVRLETGRKHQIRVHLSEMGCPIVGDQKYGAKTKMQGRIALHAYQLAFNHPVSGKRIEFLAPSPLKTVDKSSSNVSTVHR
jgi:23S rRNA pseudouridine1911/1915/1917 synthase